MSVTGAVLPKNMPMQLPDMNKRTIDVSKLKPAQRQYHAVMSLHHYHELCNTNDLSPMFVSPPPITNIQ